MTRQLVTPGYKAFNGYIFTASDCRQYNRIQETINTFQRERGYVPESLLNESHAVFSLIIGCLEGKA